MKQYFVVSLGELLSEGFDDRKIKDAFKKFSCRREEDLENFLMYKAITYEQIDFGKTYLCIDKEKLYRGEFVVLAYFCLAQRSIDVTHMSQKAKRKMLGEYPGRDSIKSVPAFLIGQLGRCDDCSHDELSGEQILGECYHAISQAAKIVGGRLVVLECREHMYEKFYEKQGYKKLYTELSNEELYTLYKRIDFKEYWSSQSN